MSNASADCADSECTCRAVILHLADKDAKAMLRASTHTETQPAIHTLIHRDCVDILTVIPACKKHAVLQFDRLKKWN